MNKNIFEDMFGKCHLDFSMKLNQIYDFKMEIFVAAKKSAQIGIFCYRQNFGATTFSITTFISTKAEQVALNNQV